MQQPVRHFYHWLFSPSKYRSPDDIDNDRRILFVIVMMFGCISIIIVSIWSSIQVKGNEFWRTFGLSSLTGLAALQCGGFLGFLFGIPRSLQKQDGEASTMATEETGRIAGGGKRSWFIKSS